MNGVEQKVKGLKVKNRKSEYPNYNADVYDTTRNDTGYIDGSKSYQLTRLVREAAKKFYRSNEEIEQESKQLLRTLNKQKTS